MSYDGSHNSNSNSLILTFIQGTFVEGIVPFVTCMFRPPI